MKTIDRYYLDFNAFERIKKTALQGYFDGESESQYLFNCRWWWEKYECTLIFTRDVGHHTSGWWKNPDYERCWHLSISFPGGKNKNKLNKIIDGLFGSNKNMIWIEPPYSEQGKSAEVWHYRLFCDENWNPIIPRGEVYNTEFTERGWKSFSEVNAGNTFR